MFGYIKIKHARLNTRILRTYTRGSVTREIYSYHYYGGASFISEKRFSSFQQKKKLSGRQTRVGRTRLYV